MFRPLEAIIRSRFGYPGEEDGFGCLKVYRLVFNLNYYKLVVLDVHTLLFSIAS